MQDNSWRPGGVKATTPGLVIFLKEGFQGANVLLVFVLQHISGKLFPSRGGLF